MSSKTPRVKMAVDPLDGPLNELYGGLVAAAQRLTEEVTMVANTMEKDAIEQWATQHGLTFDQAHKLVSWDEEEGLQVRVPPHKRPKPWRKGTMAQMARGQRLWLVHYNDNSDYGRIDVFFETEEGARVFADDLASNPPKGNYFHPAPERLDLKIYAVECLR